MGKIPYMPFYIGDWEQDMNACSLQTEAAWLKVIVKMFKDDKCGIYKTSTKRLQILWKCGPEMVEEIISELQGEDIGEIKRDTATGAITFFNRRMIREKEISKKRSEAVQTRYKTPTKPAQIPEYENDNEDGIERVKEWVGKNSEAMDVLRRNNKLTLVAVRDEFDDMCKYYRAHPDKPFPKGKPHDVMDYWLNNSKKFKSNGQPEDHSKRKSRNKLN